MLLLEVKVKFHKQCKRLMIENRKTYKIRLIGKKASSKFEEKHENKSQYRERERERVTQ